MSKTAVVHDDFLSRSVGTRPAKGAVFAFTRKAHSNAMGIRYYCFWVVPSRQDKTCVAVVVIYNRNKQGIFYHSLLSWTGETRDRLIEAIDHARRLEQGKRMAKALERK